MDKRPFVTKAQLDEIVKTYPTPFHLYDEKGIRENAMRVKEAFAWNHGYKEYFAVKATPNPYLISLLGEMGIGCDCSSFTELMLAKACGITGHDIMFSSNDTPAEDMRYAAELGAIINLDDFTMIDFLDSASMPSSPATPCRMTIIPLCQRSFLLSWSGSRRRPARICASSTFPAAWAYPTVPTSGRTTFSTSAMA